MHINELDSFKLSDAVSFHDNLNPKLWRNQDLRPEVKNQLMIIARDFLEELGIKDIDVKDITISGSNAAYSYTKHSDLDLHILLDMTDYANNEVYQEFFNAKKTLYNDSHNITLHGIPVELYVQDMNQPVRSLGEYSLLQDKWLKIPSKRRANFDQTATKAKYDKLLDFINLALKLKDTEKLNTLLKKIRQYRQAGLDKGGEFGPENLAYKALRSQGYITKLYDLRDKLHSEKLSIESMYQEDYDPNGPPPGPEFKPTMPKGTVRVDVSDVYDWYKLGQHISNMKGLGKHDFGKGPPSTIMAFGDEDTEHQYIKDLEKTGLTTTDIDPVDPNQPKGMKRQKVDPTYNVNEKINPEVTQNSFHAEKEVNIKDVGLLKLVAYNIDDEYPQQFKIDAITPDGKKIGYFRFVVHDYEPEPKYKIFSKFAKKKDPYVLAGNVSVWSEYQKKGIASEVYKWVKSMGNDIKPSTTQTSAGKAMWRGFEKNKVVGEEEKPKQASKSAIYSTDVYGMTAYHSKCLEPGCDWESKRYDSIKLAQNAAQKHAQKHFKQSVAEEVTESRESLFSWLKQQFPTWPDYVVKDFLYQQAKTITSQEQLADFLEIQKKDFGKVKWRLEKLPITLDIFTPKTQRMIKSREGGSSNPFKVPKDAERHAQQLKMIQQHGVRTEPIIVAKLSNGYDLIEGWHRTIQHLKAFPEGYTGPAWVGYGATYTSEIAEQGVEKGYSNTTFNVDRRKLNVPALIQKGAIFVTYPHGEQGWETDNKEDWAFSLLSLYNVLQGGWPSEAKKYLKPESYKRAEQQINSSAPNLGSDKLVYDGKYNQILWSIKKLGIPDDIAFLDKGQQSVAEAFDKPYKLKWEKGDYGDVDAYAKLPDGNYLSIMFNKGYSQGTKEEAWSVEFYRNNSQEVTGEGDAQRVFATVLGAIQTFIKKYKPNRIIFSASKEVEQGQNAESRASLYDRLVQRYAKSWGFRAFRADTGNKVIYELDRINKGVAETRTNPEQNSKPESGFKELASIAKTISDPENWAISMTSEPKLGINPQVGISEDTPKGIYFYPLNYALSKIRNNRQLPWGNDYPYIQLFQYDRSREMTKQTKVDPAKLKQALSQYCPEEVIQQAIDDPEYDGTPYWFIYDCLSRLGKNDETNVVRWNKVLRDLGFTSVYDDGDGWIAYNEPTQGVILDPRIIKQHKTIINKQQSRVVTPAVIEQTIFETMDMELARNRAWQAYDPDGSKLRQAAKEYAKKPEFKQYYGKPGTEEIFNKAEGWGRYGARQLSDIAYEWWQEQKAQSKVNEASGYIPSEKQKNDPRFKTALTVDIKPDTMKKDAKKFGNKISRAGIPPPLKPSGKF